MKKVAFRGKKHWLALLMIGAGILAGCGDSSTHSSNPSTAPTAPQGPQNYLATTSGLTALSDFQIDDKAKTFASSTFNANGSHLTEGGSFKSLSRGLLCLETSTDDNCSQPNGWAVELAGQGGGLVQMDGGVVNTLAAASCPGATSQTFQFVTIPGLLPNDFSSSPSWDPLNDTAYGSVDIAGTGQAVNFSGIHQFALAGVAPLSVYQTLQNTPAISSQSGTCSQTFYGNTISVPTDATLTLGSVGQFATPPGIVGVGASGLLVENNGWTPGIGLVPAAYQPFLGAGSGAIGLPKPSSPFDTNAMNALVGAQYLGFFYSSGYLDGTLIKTGSSQVASFGFPSLPADGSCQSVAAQTPTMIYGGDFANNDPRQASDGFGICDVAIDLGAQSGPGLFPKATIWLKSKYAGNLAGSTYSFPAVAIAGQLGGKYAIFLIAADTDTVRTPNVSTPNRSWGIYLLQSN